MLSSTSVLLFLTANKTNGREGKVFCVRSDDRCRSWQLQSFVDTTVRLTSTCSLATHFIIQI